MRNIDWNQVQDAVDFPRPKPGGYVVYISKVEDVENKEYLKIYYDFVEGDLRGYYGQLFKNKGFWGGNFIRSYKEKALPFFKAFKTSVEESNPGYVFKNDPQSLVRKYVGVVIAEEEYEANDGSIKTRLYVDKPLSVDSIKAKKYEVPPLKKIDHTNDPFTDLGRAVDSLSDADDPFNTLGRTAQAPAQSQSTQGDLFAGRYNVDDGLDDLELPF